VAFLVAVPRLGMDQILAAVGTDKEIATKFNAVAYMTAHPASLAAPGTVLRAIAVNIRGRQATIQGRPAESSRRHT
jgi:hypothetical protein